MQRLVKKSNYWVEHIEAEFNLSKAQLKLLAKLASLVHKDDADFKQYEFNIRTLLIELNLGEENYHYLREITKDMAAKVAEIPTGSSTVQTGLIYAEYPDDLSMLKLSFHRDMKPYFLRLRGRFLRYDLGMILRLKGKYSMRLYDLFKANQYLGGCEKSIEFLRHFLNIPKGKYTLFAHFKNRVIEDSITDIVRHTDLKTIKYQYIKQGRKVIAIKFVIPKSLKKDSDKMLSSCKDIVQEKKVIEKEIELLSHEIVMYEGKISFYEECIDNSSDDEIVDTARKELVKLEKKVKRVLQKKSKKAQELNRIKTI